MGSSAPQGLIPLTPGSTPGAGKPHTQPNGGGSSVASTGEDTFPPASLRGGRVSPFPVTATRHAPRPPQLDARLRAAADWVQDCDVCADIGCDHGRFGAALLTENRCRHLLAADISEKALSKAKARLRTLGLQNRATLIAADGLEAIAALPGARADTICILGLGGETVAGILLRGTDQLQGATLILGAQTDLPLVRETVTQIGYQLADEHVVNADGRMYLLMRAMPAAGKTDTLTEQALLLGPCLLERMPAEWLPWLTRKQRLLSASVTSMRASGRDVERLALSERELAYTEDALRRMRANAESGLTEGEEAR